MLSEAGSKRLQRHPLANPVLSARCESTSPIIKEQYSCEHGSAKFYALCGVGGIVSCGTTHSGIVPLDIVKCRIQVDPTRYKGIADGFRLAVKEGGFRSLSRGWSAALVGYSLQGLGKFGFYEFFKVQYSSLIGEELSYQYRTWLYLGAAASAEFLADIALCPWESLKVRIQTAPGFPSSIRKGLPYIWREEGFNGFYKGLVPLWARQIPYTMMKFASFERTLEALYKYVVPKPRDKCSKPEQLGITFLAGYIAGVLCAIVSHPPDTIISVLNRDKGSTFMEVARKLGMIGMWKGLVARIHMIGTLTALQWFIYDGLKVALRIPRPPPPEMPESMKKRLGITE